MTVATGAGLCCPICGSKETAVTDSRAGTGFIRRRRKCLTCTERNRFSTLEVAVESPTHSYSSEPVFQALKILSALDAMPGHKQQIVLSLIAAFAADGGARDGHDG